MDTLKQYFIDAAYDNSYAIIVKGTPIETILSSETPYFAHPPYDLVDKELVNMLIKHFEEREEYEKCKGLQEFWNSGTTSKKLATEDQTS
jgi:hypothetical protein